jgi:hypothetical protein
MIGYVADVARFPGRDRFAACNGTAPIEVSSGNRKIYRLSRRGNRRLNYVIHIWPRSPRSATGTATAGPTTTRSSPKAKLPGKPSAASNGKSATPSTAACGPTPAGPQPQPQPRAREGNRGPPLSPARPAHTPKTGSSAQPLPSPTPPYDPRAAPHLPGPMPPGTKSEQALDAMRLRSASLTAARRG